MKIRSGCQGVGTEEPRGKAEKLLRQVHVGREGLEGGGSEELG